LRPHLVGRDVHAGVACYSGVLRSERPIGRDDSGATLPRCYGALFTAGQSSWRVCRGREWPWYASRRVVCLGLVRPEVVGVAAGGSLGQAVERQAKLVRSSLQAGINYSEGRGRVRAWHGDNGRRAHEQYETTTGDQDSNRTGFCETRRMAVGREGPMGVKVKVKSARTSTSTSST
jgi:hypothetical protein